MQVPALYNMDRLASWSVHSTRLYQNTASQEPPQVNAMSSHYFIPRHSKFHYNMNISCSYLSKPFPPQGFPKALICPWSSVKHGPLFPSTQRKHSPISPANHTVAIPVPSFLDITHLRLRTWSGYTDFSVRYTK